MSSRADRLKAMQNLNTKNAGKYDTAPTRNDDLTVETAKDLVAPQVEYKVISKSKKENTPAIKKAIANKEKSTVSKKNEESIENTKADKEQKNIKPAQADEKYSKKKRLSLGLPGDTIEYLKIKAARTGKPMYVLVTEILDEAIENALSDKLNYVSPIVKQYRTRLVKPDHLAVDISYSTSEKVLEIAQTLGLTATQFYNLAINEYKIADKDFIFSI